MAWAFFDKPQPFVPDFEEKMTVPKWFRLRSSGGDWYDEFEEPTTRCPMKAWTFAQGKETPLMERIYIKPTDRVFVLTGAGMSAESGIPTFRDANGLWRNYRVEEVASPDAWQRDPQLVWDFYSMRRTVAAAAQPNPGHRALATLERTLGSRLFPCTQNVDNLHEQAGSRPLHMHGELFKSRCERCQLPFDDTNIYREVPLCACGGKIRPHICWFGERPFGMDRVLRILEVCTVFIAIGTSGVVEPAASFVGQTKARTFHVGPEEPLNLASFDESFEGKSGELLPTLFDVGAPSL